MSRWLGVSCHLPANWALVACLLCTISGCPSSSPTESVQNEQPKPAESVNSVSIDALQPEINEKTEDVPKAVKPLPELPPELPSSQDLAAKELEKIGAKVVFNRNDDVVEVDFAGQPVTDEYLKLLEPFFFLRSLTLIDAKITDDGLAALGDFEYLRFLYLYGTSISDAGLSHLRGLSRLERLCLDHTQVSDTGLSDLKIHNRLQLLHLDTKGEITEAGLVNLYGLNQLQELKLPESIPPATVAELQEQLPEAEILQGDAAGMH